MRLFANANFDFIGYRRRAYVVSALFIGPGLILLLVLGMNFGIEFTGGTLVQVEMREASTVGAIRTALLAAGITGAEIQTFGSQRSYVIRARLRGEETERLGGGTQRTAEAVEAALAQALGEGAFRIERTEAVGPKVGAELREKALLAVLLSFAAVMIYLWFRFEWRFGLAAVLATIHDILATIAFIVFLRLEVSLVLVAALLTIVGYSLNDTIVVFDRVRENLKKYKRENLLGILNRSVNETLPRTVLTGLTTLAMILALVVFGGAVIRPFGLVMFFGIVVGTFSSIYVAAPVLLAIEQKWPGESARGARALEAKPEPA